MKQPKPFFRASKQAYYCQIGKRQFCLGKDEAEAYRRFYRLMAEGAPRQLEEDVQAVVVCDLFLDWAKANGKPATYEWRRHFLQSFCSLYGKVRVRDLKPYHVTRWIAKSGWGQSTQYSAISSVKRAISWAVGEGYIETDPLKSVKKPACKRREVLLSPEDRARIVAGVKDRSFQRYLFALGQTGMRPGEIRAVTAAEFHDDVLIFKDHKEAHQGKPRVVFLNEPMRLLIAELVKENPSGPLFLNTRGKPYTRNAIRIRFRNLRAKLNLPKGSVAYCYRHGYATDLLHQGHDSLTVARLLGHASTKMLEKHYAHLSDEHLKRAAEKTQM